MSWFVLEGPDGCGKSTQAALLCAFLQRSGRTALHLREPGSTPVGEALRALLLDRGTGELRPETEALLFSAARAELVPGVIAPALARGEVVVAERCWVSTVVYQGLVGGVDLDWIDGLTAAAHGDRWPTRVFVLDVPPAIGTRRRGGRTADRFEARGGDWPQRVRDGFLAAARRDPRLEVFDASGGIESVHQQLCTRVRELLA